MKYIWRNVAFLYSFVTRFTWEKDEGRIKPEGEKGDEILLTGQEEEEKTAAWEENLAEGR